MKVKFRFIVLFLGVISNGFGQNSIELKDDGKACLIISNPPLNIDFNTDIDISASAPIKMTDITIPNTIDFSYDVAKKKLKIINTNSDRIFVNFSYKGKPCQILIPNNQKQKKDNQNGEGTPNGKPDGNKKEYLTTYDYLIDNDENFKSVTKRYNRKENMAYFYFNEKGQLLGPAPVNIDADDFLEINIAIPDGDDRNLYYAEVEGDYNPSDLSIRPYDSISHSVSQSKKSSNFYTIKQKISPFTSETVIIKIFYNGELLKQHNVKINKLYHVAIGVSFVSTELEKPSYEVAPLGDGTGNTINTINTGSRTLATFNVIFYWKPTVDWALGKLKNNSNITRGRDILKEATFWERLNPTFGVAINKDWRENFFVGGNFEFARGGSLTAGWHYAKVQELADKSFELGKTVYSGTKEQIRLTDTWKWGVYFGITLDTRIFNLFTTK